MSTGLPDGAEPGRLWTWYIATRYPDTFAAIAPMSGFTSHLDFIDEHIDRLANMPIWAFHGGLDTVVPFEETERIVKRLERRNRNLRFSAEPDIGHWIHWQVYPARTSTTGCSITTGHRNADGAAGDVASRVLAHRNGPDLGSRLGTCPPLRPSTTGVACLGAVWSVRPGELAHRRAHRPSRRRVPKRRGPVSVSLPGTDSGPVPNVPSRPPMKTAGQFVIAVIALCGWCAPAPAQDSPLGQASISQDQVQALIRESEQRIDAVLAREVYLPGLAIAIVSRDGVVWERAFGYRDPDDGRRPTSTPCTVCCPCRRRSP